jgi:hypothetical protein
MNAQPHLSDEVLLHKFYGIADGVADAHLQECAECAGRLQVFATQREASVTDHVSSDFLAAQRRAIYQRLGRPRRKGLSWAPALAATCAVVLGVFLYHPSATHVEQPAVPTAVADSNTSDAQLFSELYSMDQSLEPAAAAPIRSLFEEKE